jgi:YVTN family beta-propeller protein
MRIILASLMLSVLYTGAALAQTYIANISSDTVSVISDGSTVTVDVGRGPIGLAVTPDGDFVYVANSGSNNVSVIDTKTNMVAHTVDVGMAPFGAAVTLNGDFVYITNSGSNNVSVIDVSTNKVG